MISTLGVRIELKGECPKAKLKLVITTDSKELIEYEVGKSEPIHWTGKWCEYMPLFLCSYQYPATVLVSRAPRFSSIKRRPSESSSLRVLLFHCHPMNMSWKSSTEVSNTIGCHNHRHISLFSSCRRMGTNNAQPFRHRAR